MENMAVLVSAVCVAGVFLVLCASFMRIWPENLAADLCLLGLILLFGIATMTLCCLAVVKKQSFAAKMTDFGCFGIAGLVSLESFAHCVSEQFFGWEFDWWAKWYFMPMSVIFVCGLLLKIAGFVKERLS